MCSLIVEPLCNLEKPPSTLEASPHPIGERSRSLVCSITPTGYGECQISPSLDKERAPLTSVHIHVIFGQ